MLATPAVRGQLLHPTDPLPTFEVATIKPVDPNGHVRIDPLGSTQIVQVAGRKMSLVGTAFNVATPARLVAGFGLGLGWSDSSTVYVVQAKIPDDVYARMETMTSAERRQQAQLMLQSLLAERFGLKFHFQTMDMPIYELVVDKSGSKLPAPNAPPIAAGGGWAMSAAGDMRIRNLKLDELLQNSIFGVGDRPIVNKTGLDGTYDLKLHWKPPSKSNAAAAESVFFPSTPAADDGPSIFTVLQEQLGLKLVPARGPVEVVVVDHIEDPSAN
jgi:uncharacterized protein (TIGR03435 family)